MTTDTNTVSVEDLELELDALRENPEGNEERIQELEEILNGNQADATEQGSTDGEAPVEVESDLSA